MNKLTKSVIEYQKTKCIKKRNQIIEDNLAMVKYLIKNVNRCIFNDVLHECVLLFIQYLDRFNYKKNKVEFSTYFFNSLKYDLRTLATRLEEVVTIKKGTIGYEDYVSKKSILGKSLVVDIEETNDDAMAFDINHDELVSKAKKHQLSETLNKTEKKMFELLHKGDRHIKQEYIAKILKVDKRYVKYIKHNMLKKVRGFFD